MIHVLAFTQYDGSGGWQSIVPFVLGVLDCARCKTMLPSGIYCEMSGYARSFKHALIAKPGLFEQLPRCCIGIRFTWLKAAGDRLPHLNRIGSLEQQGETVVSVNDDQDRNGPAKYDSFGAAQRTTRRAAPAGGYQLP